MSSGAWLPRKAVVESVTAERLLVTRANARLHRVTRLSVRAVIAKSAN